MADHVPGVIQRLEVLPLLEQALVEVVESPTATTLPYRIRFSFGLIVPKTTLDAASRSVQSYLEKYPTYERDEVRVNDADLDMTLVVLGRSRSRSLRRGVGGAAITTQTLINAIFSRTSDNPIPSAGDVYQTIVRSFKEGDGLVVVEFSPRAGVPYDVYLESVTRYQKLDTQELFNQARIYEKLRTRAYLQTLM